MRGEVRHSNGLMKAKTQHPEQILTKLNDLLLVLEKYWGHSTFRSAQIEPVLALASGRHVLAILPTGGGKSICYQVAGIHRGGICLVISPLISLMEDQVRDLKKRNIKAISLAGNHTPTRLEQLLDNVTHGGYRFVYCSPERLESELFIERSKSWNVQTVAVDEAHCISQWGTDFRPAYRNIPKIQPLFPHAVWGAFTATANAQVAADINHLIFDSKAESFRQPMRRPNLQFAVYQKFRDSEAELLNAVRLASGSGLIYVRSRFEADKWASRLRLFEIKAQSFHAGLPAEERTSRQAQWMDGTIRVMCCTSAFGMGVDKKDVRFVYHAYMPQDVESYVQEAGRAGRDGQPSECILFMDEKWQAISNKQLKRKMPTLDLIRQVYQAVVNQGQIAVGECPDLPILFYVESWSHEHQQDPNLVLESIRVAERMGIWRIQKTPGGPALRIDLSKNWKTYLPNGMSKNEKFDRLVKFIERNLKSSSSTFAYNEIEGKTGLQKHDLRWLLQQFQNWGVLQFREMNLPVSLDWLSHRVETNQLRIDDQLLNGHQKTLAWRWEKMEHYIQSSECRQKFIQSYFDMTKGEDCGHCDRCIQSNMSTLKKTWLAAIPEHGISLDDWMSSIRPFEHPTLLNCLKLWQEEGEIICLDSRVLTC